MIDALRTTIAALPIRRAYNLYNRKLDVRSLPARLQFWKLKKQYYKDLWANAASNVNAEFVPAESGYHQIKRHGMTTFVNQTRVQLNDSLSEAILINKALTQQLLSTNQYPVPQFQEVKFDDFDQAVKFHARLNKPLVVKPASGTAGGKGVTTNVQDEATLRKAFKRASLYCDTILLEEFVEGHCYRLTYLDGVFIDGVLRGPPSVIGDGKSTIAQLIKLENNRRLTERPISSVLPIMIDADCRNRLELQGLSTRSKPQDGEHIVLKTAINEYRDLNCRNIKSEVHPETVTMGARIAKDTGMTWVGLDVMCQDISMSPTDSNCKIIELNAPAGIHHHYLIDDPATVTPVAELLLEFMFTNQRGVMRL